MKHTNSLRIKPGLIGLLVVLSLVATACYSSAAAQNQASPSPVAGAGIVMVVDSSQFGQILATSDGKALYTNTVDKPDDLRCTNLACTSFWMPYTVDAAPGAVEGVPGALGTVSRPDGSLQLTYNQMPVYTFYLDKGSGDVQGEGFEDLGGTWHIVTLSGSSAGSDGSGTSVPGGGIHY